MTGLKSKREPQPELEPGLKPEPMLSLSLSLPIRVSPCVYIYIYRYLSEFDCCTWGNPGAQAPQGELSKDVGPQVKIIIEIF